MAKRTSSINIKVWHTSIRMVAVALAGVFISGLVGPAVFAMSAAQQQVFDYGIGYFDVQNDSCDASGTGDTTGSSSSGGSDIVKFLADWEVHESGGGGGEYNPYNYTQPPSFPAYNSAGVRNYPDYQTGIKETVAFFSQTNMAKFLAALKSGNVQATATALNDFYSWPGAPAEGSLILSDMNSVDLNRTIPSMPGHTIGQFATDLLTALNSGTVPTGGSSSGCSGGVVGPVQGSIVQTAVNLAWDDVANPAGGVDTPACYSGGQAINPEPSGCHHGFQQRAGNGPSTNTDPTQYTPPSFIAAIKHGDGVDGTDYTDCGAFVATVMHASGVDPNYPSIGTSTQLAYAESHPEKFQIINNVTSTAQIQPGDIFVNSDHTFIYVGPQADGYSVAEASQFNHSPEVDHAAYFAGFTLVRVKSNG